jgi:protoheme ferro-lyase
LPGHRPEASTSAIVSSTGVVVCPAGFVADHLEVRY